VLKLLVERSFSVGTVVERRFSI